MKLSSRTALVVVGLVVALTGTLTLSAYAQQAPASHPAAFVHGQQGHGLMAGRMLDRMLDSVNATDQQRAQVKQITQAAAADLKAQREANRGLHEQMMQALAQPNIDANAVEALRQKQIAAHDQASKRMTQAMLDVSRVLTPDQRRMLADKMKQRHDMMERHMRERQELEGKPRS